MNWVREAAQVAGLSYLLVKYVAEVNFILGESMSPTLSPEDWLVSVRAWRAPRVGDVVIVHSPVNPHTVIVKRVAAVAGSSVRQGPWNQELSVPAGHIWVLGDNADNSRDSREFGAVPVDLVQAYVAFRAYPLTSAGAID